MHFILSANFLQIRFELIKLTSARTEILSPKYRNHKLNVAGRFYLFTLYYKLCRNIYGTTMKTKSYF